jgi:hypothetical protein
VLPVLGLMIVLSGCGGGAATEIDANMKDFSFTPNSWEIAPAIESHRRRHEGNPDGRRRRLVDPMPVQKGPCHPAGPFPAG